MVWKGQTEKQGTRLANDSRRSLLPIVGKHKLQMGGIALNLLTSDDSFAYAVHWGYLIRNWNHVSLEFLLFSVKGSTVF